MLGELKKMTLTGYKDNALEQPTGDVYTALLNPETFTLNDEIQSNAEQPAGTSANQKPFVRIAPRKLEFEFLFDSTGALPGNALGVALPLSTGNQGDVWAQVEQFKKTVFTFVGDSHQPPFVKLAWGKFVFRCKAEKVSVNYKLFKPDGTPIRATAKVAFVEVVPDPLRVARENAKSADLTHVRTVQAGDNLPLLCFRLYGDATLYREVARVNKLVNFRSLRVGQQLFFPPLQTAIKSP